MTVNPPTSERVAMQPERFANAMGVQPACEVFIREAFVVHGKQNVAGIQLPALCG